MLLMFLYCHLFLFMRDLFPVYGYPKVVNILFLRLTLNHLIFQVFIKNLVFDYHKVVVFLTL